MVGWYILGSLGLALLMVVHEAGHFFAARAFGMRVTKFSIGFGPTFFKVVPADGYFWFTTALGRVRLRLWKHDPAKHGPTVYQFAMIPFLAYVQIAGMNPLEDVDPDDKGSYANASLLGRVATIFAGPLTNYVFASVLFFGSFFFGGRDVLTTEVTVVDNKPAAIAGMKSGDKIVAIDGKTINEWEELATEISKHAGQQIPIVVKRGSELVTLDVTPVDDHGRGKIFVSAVAKKLKVDAKEAAWLAIATPPQVVRLLVTGMVQWIMHKAEGELAGPAGIVSEAAKAAKSGFTDLLFFLGSLSAYLGAFNLIPFPALDGGRLIFLGYEAATRRRANARVEAQIHIVGFLLMIGVMIFVTYSDVQHLVAK